MKTICIYHSKDLDGYCSGAIVKKRYPDCELIGYDYGEPFPWDRIEESDEVIMVDVSISVSDMIKLQQLTKNNLTWIDHHISAIKEYNKEGLKIPGPRNIDVSACELTWVYFFPDRPLPRAVELLGKYDTWRKDDEWETKVLPFQFGMRVECTSPETFRRYFLSEENFEHIQQRIDSGLAILAYLEQTNRILMQKNAFESKFKGLNAICFNGQGYNSLSFQSVYNPEKHDIMIGFYFDGTKYNFTLYTTHDYVDCSELAKESGGGGHKMAAGFMSVSLESVFEDL